MNTQLSLVFLLLFVTQNMYGQTTRTSVYFKADQFALAPKQHHTLDTLINFLADKEIKKVILKGNTDSDADSLYNLTLSEKRALTVKDYLIDRSFNPRLLKQASLEKKNPLHLMNRMKENSKTAG
jgi:outer membrane protein OmpA-like peptidoglycan-associated protein